MAIKADYVRMREIASELKQAATTMQDILDNITTEYKKIGNPDVWAGHSANEAKAKFETLSAKFPEFSQAINECNEHVMWVAADYEEQEKAAEAALNG